MKSSESTSMTSVHVLDTVGERRVPRLRGSATVWAVLGALLLLSPLVSRPSSQPGLEVAEEPPNILFIYLDDFGWRDAGYMGSDFYETPHLDALAEQGTRVHGRLLLCRQLRPGTRLACCRDSTRRDTGSSTSGRDRVERRRTVSSPTSPAPRPCAPTS